MFIPKNLKWFFIIFLCALIFTCSRRFANREEHPVQNKLSACEKGGKCTTQLIRPKPTKPTATKRVKLKPQNATHIPYPENVHILPKTRPQDLRQVATFTDNDKRLQRKLLILSYFDWGNPSLDDILSQHPDVFYFDEPLVLFDSSSLKDGEEPVSRRLVIEAVEHLEDLMDCRIVDSTRSDRALKKMAKRAYKDCLASAGNVSECVQSSCKSSRIVIAKTIRLYVQDVRDILSRSNGLLKVVILQRDPRVNLNLRNQRTKPGWVPGKDTFFQGRSLCSRMLHDVQEAKRLDGGEFRGFYRIVLFEHFLMAPETVLRSLFAFLGVETDVDEVRRVLKVSSGYKQIRRALLNRWDWLPEEDACVHIDKACSFFYKNSLFTPLKQKDGYLQRYNLCKYCD